MVMFFIMCALLGILLIISGFGFYFKFSNKYKKQWEIETIKEEIVNCKKYGIDPSVYENKLKEVRREMGL